MKYLRQRNGIPDPPPPDPDSHTMTIKQAATELGVCHTTVYRWLRAGLLPGEQVTPNAPWRVRLTDEIRAQFVPAVPDGYLPLDEAAKRLGVARQTVLHQVQRRPTTRDPRHPRTPPRPTNPGATSRSWTVCTMTNTRRAV